MYLRTVNTEERKRLFWGAKDEMRLSKEKKLWRMCRDRC